MSIEVKFFANFRDVVKNKKITISAENVRDLLEKIVKNHNSLEDKIFRDSQHKEVNDFVNILVNGRRINVLEGLETNLSDGDTVAIFPPVAGG